MLKLAGECIEGQLAEHEASIDAHSYQLMDKLRTGKNQILLPIYYFGTVTVTANRLVGTFMLVPRDMTLSHLVIEVTSAAAAGKVARLGIYNVGDNLYPGSLLLDAGSVAVDSTGLKTLQISGGQSLTRGIYFIAVISDGAPTIRQYSAAWSPLGANTTNLAGIAASLYKGDENPAALANPFPTPDGEWSNGYGAVRISSLD
jgi:hypothetical protein